MVFCIALMRHFCFLIEVGVLYSSQLVTDLFNGAQKKIKQVGK